MTQKLQWLSVDLATGLILAYLPGIEWTQPLRRTLGAYDSATVTLHVTDDIDPNWQRAILPGATALIGYNGDSGNEVIEWGGIVIQSPRTLGREIQIAVATPDAYLDSCYVGDYTASAQDQNTIATDVVSQFAAGDGQIPIVTQVIGDPGTARDRTYTDASNTTVYAILQELMGVQGGPEWCMSWQWTHNPDLIVPVFQVGTRIGTPATPGLGPTVTFESPQLQTAQVAYDYSSGIGANKVVCYSSSSGLVATSVADDLMGRPIWEYRFTPSTSIQTLSVLQAHSDQALAAMENGSLAVSASVTRDLVGQQLGIDWNLGDDVGVLLRPGNAIPLGLGGVTRCIAYEITPTMVTPILSGGELASVLSGQGGSGGGSGGGGGGSGGTGPGGSTGSGSGGSYTPPAGSILLTTTDPADFVAMSGVNTHANFTSYEA